MAKRVKKWFKDKDAFELGAVIFIVVGIILVLIAIGLGIKTRINLEGGDGWQNITTYSEFIAGLIGGIWSLAGVLLFYSSLSSQKADLEAQKDLLVKQIDEVVAQTKEFRIQNEMAKDQKNEETFFQLLRFHNEIITSIELEQSDVDFSTGENITKTVVGRKAFVEYYDIFKRFFGETSESMSADTEENLAKLFDKCYNTFYLEYQADLGHYFRNLYNVLRYIKSVKKESQPFFLSLLIAQLSNYELTMLFFHCLRSTNKDFKYLVEEFEVLAQVPKDEVTSMAYVLYDIKAFGEDGFGSGDILDDQDDIDIDSDSLLGQISQGAEMMSEEEKGSSKGQSFMDDLLSRLKTAQEDIDDEVDDKDVEIEGEEDGFLSEFFDRQEKEKELKRSQLLVEKEKVEQKEKEELDIDHLIEKGSDESDVMNESSLDLDFFMEDSSNYDNTSELDAIKSRFKDLPKEENDDADTNVGEIDFSSFMDSETEDESKSEPKSADDLLDSLSKGKEIEKEESEFDFGKSDIEDMDIEDLSEKLDSGFDEAGFIDEEMKNNNANKDESKKSKKKFKVKPRKDDNKPKGGSGFLSKL